MRKNIVILAVGIIISLTTKAQLADGGVAPDFTLSDINGNSHNLYTYLNQGKTVFIDFFACHCGTCWAYHNQKELENLNAAHGPNGTQSQDVVVIAIEYDANNGTNEFYGISGVTQGNWIAGTTYPFCNPENGLRTQTLTDYAVNYFPLIYGICPDKTIYNVGTQTATQFYTFASSCFSAGVNSIPGGKDFQAYASGNTLFVKSQYPCFQFDLYNVNGQVILSKFIEGNKESLSIESLSSGVYYYRTVVNGNCLSGKIFK